MARLGYLLGWCLLLGSSRLLGAVPTLSLEPPNSSAGCALASSIATLQLQTPPAFHLRYRGAVMPWRGPLCYHFEGYNRTCQNLAEGWLTAASELRFPAPGQVPADLLEGYRLILSAPQMFVGVLRFEEPSADSKGWSAQPPAGWNCPAP